jgi:hypothetical protein
VPPIDITPRPEPSAAWNGFAEAHGGFYHRAEWLGVIARCFSFGAVYFEAHRSGELVGIMPVADVPSLLGPRRLVSLPFSYAVGPVATSREAASALVDGVRRYAVSKGVARVEVKRWPGSQGEAPEEGFTRVSHYDTYRVSTAGGADAVFARLHPSHVQRGIKKARKGPLEAVDGRSLEDWATMAMLQARTSHRLGTPAPPARFFTGACRALQEHGLTDLLLARLPSGEAVAGLTLWKGPREWIYSFGASLPAHLELRPNHLLLWTALERATAAGVDFDLGRAAPEQHGLAEFKRRWAGEPIPLAYDYWPRPRGLNVAARDTGPLATAAKLWSQLPFSLARRGSFLYRYLG